MQLVSLPVRPVCVPCCQPCSGGTAVHSHTCVVAGCRYGLTKQPAARQHMARVELSIASFKLWCCTLIQLNRPKRVRCIGHIAWQSLRSLLMRFMGYTFKMMEVPEPSLHHFLNPYLVSSFVAFLHARGVRRETLANAVVAATKVVTWLQATSQLSATDTAR